jgi:hypothetical protein
MSDALPAKMAEVFKNERRERRGSVECMIAQTYPVRTESRYQK